MDGEHWPAAATDDARYRRLFLALRRAITANFEAGHWSDLEELTGTSEIVSGHNRLYRSLYFGDDDYDYCVGQVLSALIEVIPINRLAAIVDDLIDLDGWIRANEPHLYRELFAGGEAAALAEIERSAQAVDIPEIHRHIARIRAAADTDPSQAIGSAKELLETVCKVIIGNHGPGHGDDLMGLAKQARRELGLDGSAGSNSLVRIVAGHAQIVQGVAEIRNTYGTGHGRVQVPEPDPAVARLVVDSTSALALYYLTLWGINGRMTDVSTIQ